MIGRIFIIIMMGLLYISSCDSPAEKDAVDYTGVLLPGHADSLPSPTGKYTAAFADFDDGGVRSYTLQISKLSPEDCFSFTTDVTFRARDSNFAVWADDEDILWAYNGDIGTFYWIVDEKGVWVKNSFAENKNAKIPSKLIELRPRLLQ